VKVIDTKIADISDRILNGQLIRKQQIVITDKNLAVGFYSKPEVRPPLIAFLKGDQRAVHQSHTKAVVLVAAEFVEDDVVVSWDLI
jgi:hypothetical protein